MKETERKKKRQNELRKCNECVLARGGVKEVVWCDASHSQTTLLNYIIITEVCKVYTIYILHFVHNSSIPALQ